MSKIQMRLSNNSKFCFIALIISSLAFAQTYKTTFPAKLNIKQYSSFGYKSGSFGHKISSRFQLQTNEKQQEETPLIHELGYIFAQQVAFGGLSYLASREKGYGPCISGGFDIFIGTLGALNIMDNASPKLQFGYVAITAGFVAKTVYTFKLGNSHSIKQKFWISYIAYNVLIYFGYYLDSL